MRIGFDIDNVITDMDSLLLKEFLKEDKNKRNNGIINKNARHIVKGMFDWSEYEVEEFLANNMERIAKNFKPIDGMKELIDKLIKEGHEVYLISNRVYPHYKEARKTTEDWLLKYNIKYNELILTETIDKSNACKKYKIDIMFDDSVRNCLILRDNDINVCLVKTKYNYNYKRDLDIANDIKEIYERIDGMKKNIILDTDMYNEVDDQFALTYLMHSLDKFKVDAITIAPFSGSGYAKTKTIKEGSIKSLLVTKMILDILDMNEYRNSVYMGATSYFKDSKGSNEAVDKIIELAHKNEKTIIIAIGAITNVALALYKDPNIKDKIEVIWLGGNSFLTGQNLEFNFKQDIEAVRYVFNSEVNLTVIPCRNVASNLVTTTYELDNYLRGSKIGDYLCDTFKELKKHYYETLEDEYGSSKTLWDLSAVAYAINKDWFETKEYSCPNILDDGSYQFTTDRHKVNFVNDLYRNKIFKDYFIKMEKEKVKTKKIER